MFTVITAGYGFSIKTYAAAADGESYQAYANAILGSRSLWTEYDKRVFPGYPLLIAATHEVTRLPMEACALAVTWISAALAAALAAALFQDRRIGWAMVMLIPHWPINSSLAMGEAPMLALTLAGLLLSMSGRYVSSGLLLGFAVLVRPVACFPLAGAILARYLSRKRGEALATAAISAVVLLGGLQVVKWATGDALYGVKVYSHSSAAYGGQIFTWPFHSLLQTTFQVHPPLSRLFYIWAHVLIVLLGCLLLAAAPGTRTIGMVAFCWLAGNTLFTLCVASGPYGWGFYHFPRFCIPATPALFWAIRRTLPSRTWIWAALAVVMLLVSVAGVHQALTAGPQPRVFAGG